MNVIRTEIPDVLIIEPKLFHDERGTLFESYNRRAFAQATGIDPTFVQDNRSLSKKNVLRGLHYQVANPQGKLVQVLQGEIFDVAVDVRRSSPTFGKWVGFTLSQTNRRIAWIPPGFAHGLLALTDNVDVLYKLTDFWSREHERAILWNDPQIGVTWPLKGAPILSPKDAGAASLAQAETFP